MGIEEREQIDRKNFDKGAAALLTAPLERLRLNDDDWERFDRPCPPSDAYVYAIQALGDVEGKKILDYGCGDGALSVILAKRGGRVSGFDTSEISVRVARRRAAVNGVEDRVHSEQMSAYKLEYGDKSFDLLIGLNILHHVEIGKVALEISRVLKKGGKAVFQEPLGASKWLQAFRRFVPVSLSCDEGSQERQLTYQDVEALARPFSRVICTEFQCLSRLDRVVGIRRMSRGLRRFDQWLLDTFPDMRRYARFIVIEVAK